MTRRELGQKFLLERGGWFHYQRHIPKALRGFYEAPLRRLTLGTQSLDVAKVRRDELAAADDAYWAELKLSLKMETSDTKAARRRYELAQARALIAGFTYKPLAELLEEERVEDIVKRVLALGEISGDRKVPDIEAVEAVLGGAARPADTISDAMELYKTKIVARDISGKSPQQARLWHATKDRSLRYFVNTMGDQVMADITRDDALEYFEFWNGLLEPDNPDVKPKSAKTASRHFSDVRKLYTEYFKYLGDEDRANPFRNLNFEKKRGAAKRKRPSFSDAWVRQKILKPGAFGDTRADIVAVIMMLIETGCRHSEIINLRPEDVFLDVKSPYIRIADRDDRETKTEDSVRDIPLVGVALAAAKQFPNGFPEYRDKSNSFSAAASAALRRKGLMESDAHVIYSFRHAFEDRMKEAGIDGELRRMFMGHKSDRPKYGSGGSMEFRRSQLLKIAHRVPSGLFPIGL